jgi:hypothetical protein
MGGTDYGKKGKGGMRGTDYEKKGKGGERRKQRI